MPNTEWQLIEAGPEHAAEVLAMIGELADYERMRDEVKTDEAMLRHALTHQHAEVRLVHSEREGFVAMALFFHNFSTFAGRRGIYLEDLYVRPAWRGQGIASMLLRHLAQLAIDRHCARVEWAVLDWNSPAIEVYRHFGAQLMDEWTTCRLDRAAIEALASTT